MFNRKDYKEKQLRYSIRKVSFGAASVAISALYLLMGSAAVSASEVQAVNGDQTTVANPTAKDNEDKSRIEKTEPTTEEANSTVATLDKTELTALIAEIDGNFTNGKYASKTEESVQYLKTVLEEAKSALNNATIQAELKLARIKLVTATTKLQTKPEDKKQAPAVDTTNGKATVGIKATNTEKASGTNSIANSGSRDERHGKALDRSNPFRTDANTNTTNADPDANQTYTAPAENANLKELADKLLGLGATVENNTKLANEMNALGDSKQVEKGTVKEINEFGGWKAVDGGVFAIARRTEEGVYPLETINSTLNDIVWLREQAFDRDTEYTLLLSKSRTRANRNEEVFDSSEYQPTGVGSGITKNVARYKGIEKIFTAYSTAEGSDIIVKFKPGYVGDSDGFKANYKVQVYSITGDQESLVYETTFDPSINKNDTKYIVTKATDGTNREKIKISSADGVVKFDRYTGADITERTGFIGKREAEKLMARPENLPNGKAGTFTSKPIALPQGADHYKVRISLADQNRTGMSYQAWDEKYSIPVTGADFSIAQDTTKVAKSLLQKVYDKLLETVDKDKRGKTPETQAAYQAQLDAIKEALTPGKYTSTKNYQELLKFALEKQEKLKVDKSTLTTSTGKLEELVDDDPTPGKTPETVSEYNIAKSAAEEEARKAKLVIDDEHATVDQVAQAVADVRAKRAELRAARALLVVAATEAQKTKLQNDSDALKEADKTNKTPNSIAEYNDKYKELEAALTAAKTQAKAVLDKTVNAGKVEATDAQIEVDKIKAELEKAAALLKEKGNTAELEKAKNALSDYITQQTNDNVTAGKTKDSQDAYAIAKTAADKAVEDAAAVIASENSTVEDVANALADIKVKKAELEAAKKNLVPAATDAQKVKLEKTVAKLVETSTEGKTQDSINAYNEKIRELTEELNQAKAAAEKIKTDGVNATKLAALEAQEAVDAVLEKLEAAKEALVEKATDEQKAALEGAAAALTPIAEETLTGNKTPNSIEAYKQAVAAIQTDLTQATAKAAELVEKAKANNATKADATLALAKVEELKAKLAEAKGLLKDKANTEELTTAKDALKALAATENVTAGKTKETADKYDAAKADADQAVTDAETLIANPNATPEQVAAALANVNTKKAALEKAKEALLDKITQDQKDDLANAEESLKLADTTGKTKDSIKAYNDEVAKLNDELAAAKQEAKDLLDKGDNAGELEAYRVQAKINKLKSKLAEAAKLLKDIDKSAAKKEVENAAKKATDAIVANNDLTPEQKEAAKAKVADAANKANAEIDKVTTENDVTAAKNAGKLAIEKEAAKAEIEAAKAAKEKAIEANDKLSDAEKQAAKDVVEEAATNAIQAIDTAQDQSTVDSAKITGKDAVAAVNPVGKEKALAAIDKALAAKEKAIDANEKLSDAEKQAAKEAAKKAADDAKKAINDAQNQEAVDNAKNAGTTAVEAVNPVGKEKALDAIQKATEDKLDEIDRDDKLSEKEKAKAKAEVAKAAINAVNAINEATDQAAVDAKQAEGTKAVSEVNPVGKDKSKAEIEATKAEKTKAVEANPDLTDAQKAEAKAKIAEEAKKAIDAIDKAKTTEEVASAKESGKLAIEKEAEKAEIEAAKAAKEKAIDARTDLTDDEKAKAKAKVAEEAKKAIEAIEKAKTHDDVSSKTENGKDDIKKINPIGGKETAKKAIDEALAEKEKAIDARTDLLPNEKEAAKKAAREEAEAAKNAIDKATTSDDIKKVLDNGLDKIAKINPVGAKEEAKKAVEEALANKEKEIDERTDLTPEEKVKAKALAREEAKAAKDAIDKAIDIEAIEKALRPFLYQIDQDALVVDRPTFNLEAYIQASITGVVKVELGKAITQADIIAKLNLPENVTVISIDLPDTTTVGTKFAKVTLRLADGTPATVSVPVEVVENSKEDKQQNNIQEDSKPAAVPSNNSEQPAVNQTEDVKENSSTTSQETKGSNQKVLPNTGTGNEISIFGSAAMTVLASLGLVATSKKKEEE